MQCLPTKEVLKTMRNCSLLCVLSLSLIASCATAPAPTSPPAQAGNAASTSKLPKEDAEVVTGSRIPVRGTQPVRTVDKEEITRNTSVIGTPPKGN